MASQTVNIDESYKLLLQKIEINFVMFNEKLMSKCKTPSMAIIDDDKIVLKDGETVILSCNWDMLGCYTIENNVVYWSWPWNYLQEDEHTLKIKNFTGELPDALNIFKKDNIACDDPMLISYIFALLTEKFNYDTIYVHNNIDEAGQKIFFAFGFKNIIWHDQTAAEIEAVVKNVDRINKITDKLIDAIFDPTETEVLEKLEPADE